MENIKLKKKKHNRLFTIAISFLALIFTGALLLMLPFATKDGQTTTFLGAMFTSVSASCVTGLVVYDTFTHFTLFGQLVIITLIQIGGLGFITFGVYGMMLFRKKIGLENRELIRDSLNTPSLASSISLVKSAVKGTIIIELIGALILSTRFVGEFGFAKGVYYGFFHSISAFCNAGFDLFGTFQPFSSLVPFANDKVVMLTISALVIIGGIGFLVWEDVVNFGIHIKKYRFHSKLALASTAILLGVGTVLFLVSERSGVLSGMSTGDKLVNAFFAAITPRTAGFNSVDVASMSGAGKLLTVILMFIGGSPGSTAGGIKTVTFAVLVLYIASYIRRNKECTVFNRSITEDAVKKASTVFLINLFLALTATLAILCIQPFSFDDIFLETFSAMSTVGFSSGITRSLLPASQIVIMLLMYFGRVGSLSFALLFTEKRKVANIKYPKEQIIIG